MLRCSALNTLLNISWKRITTQIWSSRNSYTIIFNTNKLYHVILRFLPKANTFLKWFHAHKTSKFDIALSASNSISKTNIIRTLFYTLFYIKYVQFFLYVSYINKTPFLHQTLLWISFFEFYVISFILFELLS